MVQARRYQGDRYDVVWSPVILNNQYILVVRHDATSVQQELNAFLQRIAVLVLIIAVFVTLATMLTLGFTVINPILQLRDDLLAAGEAITKDLSDPKFTAMTVQRQDELGEVTVAFHDMFRRVRQEIYDRRQAEAKLRAEQEKADRLLLNILPAEIAEKLKQDQSAIADRFEEVTILFADIVSFTELSTKISPVELVSCLNEIFSAFDQLAEQHDLEKIKTIGDAYMVVGGLPTPRPDHAAAIAQMALDMQREITRFQTRLGTSFQLRIGIHTGTVVAGVIGLKKFSYDLWGDAVNLASRMESHGMVGEIQVSEVTYDRLKHKFLLEKRGLIPVKGRGEVLTYLLKSQK
jgi:class 3 adenylate cyclase